MTAVSAERHPVPRHDDDHTGPRRRARPGFIGDAPASPRHVPSYSFDPATLTGQPRGLHRRRAGADRLRRPAAASTASTPAASSTCRSRPPRARWSRATTAACGCCTRPAACTTTVIDDAMQRAPVSCSATRAQRAPSATGSTAHFDDDQGGRPRRPRASAGCATSSSTRPASCASCASTSRPATPPARTWSPRRPAQACHWIGEPATRASSTTARGQLRHRQEELAGQHPAHAGQARRRRGDDPRRR